MFYVISDLHVLNNVLRTFKLTKINYNISDEKTKIMIKGAVTSQSLFLPLTLNAEFLTMRLVLLNDVMTKSSPSSITSRTKFIIQPIVIL